ncbi:MAG: phage terminase large subunit family protein [Pseudomonadota bacterium]
MKRALAQQVDSALDEVFVDFKSPPELTCSEWADAERRLSAEASAEPGIWRTDRAPYQRAMLDAINDPECEDITVMTSSQVGKTEIILNDVGYFIDYDPAPILVLQPTLEMAETFSKDRLAPMVRDTPALHGKIKDPRARDSGNTLLHKKFPGGHVTMAGANSAASLASRPIRILMCDEVDRYPPSAGTEGDPINLAAKRTRTFWNKKKIYVSTPTITGISRIEALYEDSSKEKYHLPCPACGDYQPLLWRNLNFETVKHACEKCGVLSDQYAWHAGMLEGKWVAEVDKRKHRGFHIHEMYSPWSTWQEMVDGFLKAKNQVETLKVFVNTSLGESFEEKGEGIDGDTLHGRLCEDYEAEVPDGVLVLTMAVDVQETYLELEVCGWGEGEESWQIDYRQLLGSPTKKKVWQMLDDVLDNTYRDKHGNVFQITITMVDSGYSTSNVYDWVNGKKGRRVFAIKGVAGEGRPYVAAPSNKKKARGKGKVPVYPLGVDELKTLVYSRLETEEEGPGYCHYREGTPLEYFKGLTAEVVKKKIIKGWVYRVWVKTRPRNEPLDLRAYNIAAIKLLNPVWTALAKRQQDSVPGTPEPEQLSPAKQLVQARKKRPVKRGNYAKRWKQ